MGSEVPMSSKTAEQIEWLRDINQGLWAGLAQAARAHLPVPNGFLVHPGSDEEKARAAYQELKIREFTHFVAMRSPVGAALDVIGPDALIHTVRAMQAELPNSAVLVEVMVNSSWCGHASWEGSNLIVRASEGLRCLDPDTYLFDTVTSECESQTLHPRPRKVFRAMDGRTRTMEINDERQPLDVQSLKAIAEVARNAGTAITWVLDDRGVWLVSVVKAM